MEDIANINPIQLDLPAPSPDIPNTHLFINTSELVDDTSQMNYLHFIDPNENEENNELILFLEKNEDLSNSLDTYSAENLVMHQCLTKNDEKIEDNLENDVIYSPDSVDDLIEEDSNVLENDQQCSFQLIDGNLIFLKTVQNPVRIEEQNLKLIETVPKTSYKKYFVCQEDNCKKIYTSATHLKIHLRTHSGERPYKCETCDKAFNTSYALKTHTRIHTGHRPYICQFGDCSKGFKTSGDLAKHIRTHTGQRPFKCPIEGCNMAFTTNNIRKHHMRTHTGERPFVCSFDDCGKTFSNVTNFNNHERIHRGEKPYICQLCERSFTEYSSLYKHTQVHKRRPVYRCAVCGKEYKKNATMMLHIATSHPDNGKNDEITMTSESKFVDIENDVLTFLGEGNTQDYEDIDQDASNQIIVLSS